jgi:hypothetical protein
MEMEVNGGENNISIWKVKKSLSSWFFGVVAKVVYNFEANFT